MRLMNMGVGSELMSLISPIMERIAPYAPGEIFPSFFTVPLFQNAFVAALLVTMVAAYLGSFLLIRNLALIGDGLAHVTFGGVAVGIVLGATSPLWYALLFSVISSVLIHELQTRGILTGDAAIAIFSTGVLALGLVGLSYWGGGITHTVEGYLFGNILLIYDESFELIVWMSIISMAFLGTFRHVLLATAIDPIAVQIQGIPVSKIGKIFSIITAIVVVSMVQFVGALLVTALLVTPAATSQIVSRSFRSCIIWAQVFGLSSTIIGIYASAELRTGTGSTIALTSASIFLVVALIQVVILPLLRTDALAR
jgi:zinc transport system permease protein|tara:strand:+ start:214 stop:1146 length:933 start_codon:yes stop_codon:yes gene_type:complete